ncbi:Gfo/Idh/MocA family protein [Paenibacillus sp. J5C2022]|uniref:Gfo/Idh/MocA family protein n=1 Tax=Paenibacillus sp. J5C2022 TaxID=2977129 RepID=UPI0021CFECB6|nr:Gfo/Idh/MocA family oxidoreductase [Paenibacillus sp. J5C2022]
MEEMKYAIIGCQHAHIEIFISEMRELGHSCAGIYEPENIALAGAIARKYGIPLADDQQLLLDDSVEVVGCASINSEKIDVIELCEQYGKSVMVDKPAVVDAAGLARLNSVVERGRIQVGMLLTERFHPAIHKAQQLIAAGTLGEIVSVTMRKPHKLNASLRPDWFFDKVRCGGILIDLLTHDFDLLRWFTGKEISRTEGYVGKDILPQHPSFYNTAAVQVVMEDGCVMQLYADWHTPAKSWTWGDGRIFITGTKGSAELRLAGDPAISTENPLLHVITEQEEWRDIPLEKPAVTITEDFLARIAGKSVLLTHEAILQASSASIEADATVTYALHEMKEG